jgi:hypothetical protein
VAEYAKANKIAEEPAFAWWVNDVLRRRNPIISKVKTGYWKTTHKFGLEIPHSVAEALKIDQQNGNNFWQVAMKRKCPRLKAWVHLNNTTKRHPSNYKEAKGSYQGISKLGAI